MPEDVKSKDTTPAAIAQRADSAEFTALKTKCDALEAANKAMAQELKISRDYIDQINRKKFIPDILEHTSLTAEDIDKMATDQLEELHNTLRIVKKTVAGVGATDDAPVNPRLTVGDKFRYQRK